MLIPEPPYDFGPEIAASPGSRAKERICRKIAELAAQPGTNWNPEAHLRPVKVLGRYELTGELLEQVFLLQSRTQLEPLGQPSREFDDLVI